MNRMIYNRIFRAVLITGLLFSAGCSSGTAAAAPEAESTPVPETEVPEAQDTSPKLKEDADISTDIALGKWHPKAIIKGSEVIPLESDQVDPNDRIVLLADGTFLYQSGETRNLGPWAPIEVPGYDHTYLLSRKADGENSFMAFLPKADHNSLILFEVGENVGEQQILYAREGEESLYVEEDKTTVTGGSSSDPSESGKTGGSYEQPAVSAKKACDGESYGAGSDWAKYDSNNDGCINDIEFQNGMNDAIEKRTGGSSYSSDKTDRTGLCEFKQNGVYVCNKKAMSGYSFCQEHWDMMYAGYEAFKDTYDQVTGNR